MATVGEVLLVYDFYYFPIPMVDTAVIPNRLKINWSTRSAFPRSSRVYPKETKIPIWDCKLVQHGMESDLCR